MGKTRLWLQQAGLLTSIPFVLLVGPIGGYYIGSLLDKKWSHDPWGMAICVIIGLAASGRVTADLIREASVLQRQAEEKEPKR